MSWSEMILAYFAGFVLIQIVARWIVKNEPTTHGQLAARFLALWIGVFWPLAVPLLVMAGIVLCFVCAFCWLRDCVEGESDALTDKYGRKSDRDGRQ